QDAPRSPRFRENRAGRELRHLTERGPARVELEIPMRQVVRLVPKHHRFDHWDTFAVVNESGSLRVRLSHTNTSASGCETIRKPEVRSIASTHARFGTNQLVWSPA